MAHIFHKIFNQDTQNDQSLLLFCSLYTFKLNLNKTDVSIIDTKQQQRDFKILLSG